MEKKLNVTDFAALVGTTPKTIYQRIQNNRDLPVNEQLTTVREKVKGREITLVVTNLEQINYYKNLYSPQPVNNSKYYEMLTDNNGNIQQDTSNEPVNNNNNKSLADTFIDKLLTINDEFNIRYEQKLTELITVNKELAEVKGRQLLLEDKAGREGFYINEINDLKKTNNKLIYYIYLLITLIAMLLLGLTGFLTYSIALSSSKQAEIEINQPPLVTSPPTSLKKIKK